MIVKGGKKLSKRRLHRVLNVVNGRPKRIGRGGSGEARYEVKTESPRENGAVDA